MRCDTWDFEVPFGFPFILVRFVIFVLSLESLRFLSVRGFVPHRNMSCLDAVQSDIPITSSSGRVGLVQRREGLFSTCALANLL